jgi:flagellar hook-associated protein 3 FlgL
MTDYNATPPPPGAVAVAGAFTTSFGFPQGDPAAATITPPAMQTFLDGSFAALFDAGPWSANWSGASDQNMKNRISTNELIETSVNANDAAFRKLASAYTMLADLGVESLDQNTYLAVVDTAVRVVGEAVAGITELQADLGTAQERLRNANDRMAIQIDIMSGHIGVLEGVDTFEASARLSTLMTQIETAYAVSARIQRLTILNYI